MILLRPTTSYLLAMLVMGLLTARPCTSFAPQLLQQKRHRSRLPDTSNRLCSNSNDEAPVVVALTREEGKNDKLREQLSEQLAGQHVEIVELPCIAHADGPDYDKLEDALNNQQWDYVTITSPEAARVLASAWNKERLPNPPPSVAAVGKATEETLADFGIPVDFCPSRALAKVLIQEIPSRQQSGDAATTVLYPASAKAKHTLQNGLEERGFAVTRLNTYDTVTATWTPDQVEKAAQAMIVCVASPSSIKGWLKNSQGGTEHLLAACIGETSAQACRSLGFQEEQIFYPEKPGIPGWVDSVQDAIHSLSHPPVRA